ncbi:hydrogenase maturation nickel metallochaperone HypA/HybF [Clostridium sp. DL1XJH146]
MHELGIVFDIVKTVTAFAEKNAVTKIDTLVLQIGELASVIPKYIEDCYPAAVDGTIMEDTKLEIEILPGNAMCKECNKVFNVVQNRGKCPVCGCEEWETLSGKEFMIKEIRAC